jgi:hypothetical protein
MGQNPWILTHSSFHSGVQTQDAARCKQLVRKNAGGSGGGDGGSHQDKTPSTVPRAHLDPSSSPSSRMRAPTTTPPRRTPTLTSSPPPPMPLHASWSSATRSSPARLPSSHTAVGHRRLFILDHSPSWTFLGLGATDSAKSMCFLLWSLSNRVSLYLCLLLLMMVVGTGLSIAYSKIKEQSGI